MIKVQDIEVWGFEHAIRGMRNPMNSWDKSDSNHRFDDHTQDYLVGDDDMDLMRRLYTAGREAGPEHRKYLRQIFVSMDIVAPLYWWKEFDTYKVGTTANSCSTMHKIHAKEFTLDDFSHEHLEEISLGALAEIIKILNVYRFMFNEHHDKKDWWQLIQLLPSSYNQRRTITMNYENAVTIIRQRTGHPLDEWNKFVEILRDLPHIEEITGGNYGKNR